MYQTINHFFHCIPVTSPEQAMAQSIFVILKFQICHKISSLSSIHSNVSKEIFTVL
jgi:hypothetical protein